MITFSQLRKRISQKPYYNLKRIEQAYRLAEEIHHHQTRKSGEPFITHPLTVAEIILEAGGDENLICAAILHDTLEEDEANQKTIADNIHQQFGPDVYFLVEALSKDCSITDKVLQQKEYMAQMREALDMDVSVFFLKIADLIHNMSTIGGLSDEKRNIWISELKNLYIPLFAEHFHQVALPYRETYQNLTDRLLQEIDRYAT